jgi:RNA polymerase sigma factor (sigma-70 family)
MHQRKNREGYSSLVDIPQILSELLNEGVIGRLRTAIRGFVGNRVRDYASAEDITQDVLLKISTRLGSLNNGERIEAWAFRIARNSVADYFRLAKPSEQFQEEFHTEDLASDSRAVNADEEFRLRRKSRPTSVRSLRPYRPPTGKRCFSPNMKGFPKFSLLNGLVYLFPRRSLVSNALERC